VVFPKLILIRGAFSGFSRPLRFIAQESILEIAETNLTSFYVCFIDLATRASGKAAGNMVTENR